MSTDSTRRCTGYGTLRIFCRPAPPDANGVIATHAHYASGDNTNDVVHHMQHVMSFQTLCVGRLESPASKNAKPFAILLIQKGDTSIMQVPPMQKQEPSCMQPCKVQAGGHACARGVPAGDRGGGAEVYLPAGRTSKIGQASTEPAVMQQLVVEKDAALATLVPKGNDLDGGCRSSAREPTVQPAWEPCRQQQRRATASMRQPLSFLHGARAF